MAVTADGLPGGLDQLGRLVHAFDGISAARAFAGVSSCPTAGIEQRRARKDAPLNQPGCDRCALLTDRTIDQQIERPRVLAVKGTAGSRCHGIPHCTTERVDRLRRADQPFAENRPELLAATSRPSPVADS